MTFQYFFKARALLLTLMMRIKMDIATVIGILAAFGLVLVGMSSGSSLLAFLDIPSIMIVIGGTMGVVLICFPIKELIGLFGVVKNAFLTRRSEYQELIEKMVEFANTARRQGVLALESKAERVQDKFLKKGLQMAVDGVEPAIIRSLLQKEIENIDYRHRRGAEILTSFGTFAPALGMIGTLIGLVQMLKNMNDPSTIGPAMAVAIITTFYGAILANLIFLPMANKLRNRNQEELVLKEMMMEGILSIAVGENPRIVEAKLNAFLPPKQRVSLFEK